MEAEIPPVDSSLHWMSVCAASERPVSAGHRKQARTYGRLHYPLVPPFMKPLLPYLQSVHKFTILFNKLNILNLRCDFWYKVVGALSVLGRLCVIGLRYFNCHPSRY
jgi:hypothetical protein